MNNLSDGFYPSTIGWQDEAYKEKHCSCQKVERSFCLPGLTCVQDYGISFTDVRHCPGSDFIKVSFEITIWYESCKCGCKPMSCVAVEEGTVIFRDLPFETGCCDFYVPLPARLCHKERCGEVCVSFVVKLCKKRERGED